MTPERWLRIRPILDRALELQGEDRTAFLRDHCGNHAELKADVETLLRAEVNGRLPLDAPVGEYAEKLVGEMEATAHEVLGRRIGAYRLVREIGRGGMGQVFLAERADGEFQQRVAIKLLRPDAEGEEPDRRFRVERQILAGLEHPHIARMLDGGLMEDGQPFFVMEYIDGKPIHHYCEEHELDIAQRLALFIDVSDAVQYAHRNLVVHRDLKPANILVAGDGQVKVLDFGIAKLLEPERSDLALPETRPGKHWLTPEYAAPEQIRGEPITTVTDVYQLGVVLYELLTGRRPFEAAIGVGRHEVERAVIENAPRPPSVVAAHGGAGGAGRRWSWRRAIAQDRQRVDRRLRGDLDAIVLKALRKEPEQRYASPDRVSDDVRRYLTGRPVEARGGAAAYRARRFVRRHRVGVAMTAALILVLAGYGVTTAIQRERVIAALDHAQLEAEKSEQVAEFMIGLFESADPHEGWGLDLTGRELLGRAGRRAESLDDQPEVQARLFEVIGRTYRRLSAPASARPMAERALAIRQELHGGDHADVAASLHDLGGILGDLRDPLAERMLIRAVEMRRRLLGAEHEDVAASLFELGRRRYLRGDHKNAQQALAEALAIQRSTLGSDHLQTAETMGWLAELLWEDGDPEAAEPLIREALKFHRSALGSDVFVATDLKTLGMVLYERGDYAQAELHFREALTIKQRLMGVDHDFNVIDMTNLAVVLLEQGNVFEAGPLLLRAVAILRSHRDASPHHAQEPAGPLFDESALASALMHLGRFWFEQGNTAAAEPILRESVDISRSIRGEGNRRTAVAEGWLGQCLAAQGRYVEAEPLLLASHSALEAARGPDDRRTRAAAERLAALYEAWRPEHAQRNN